ncbi:uncharacterized protein [Rutidosis leptorrhynchoides]|uniref:uncharacterized protein n=1 Tax=Rutidosis leptorrhynchoides TaxID=125765 RepID=UPI003A98DEC3
MSMIVRYVKCTSDSVIVEESFLGFLNVNDITGKGLFDITLKELKCIGLDVNDMRDQGYDNGENMKGIHQGVQMRFLKENPRAFYTPCGCHSLNLTLCDMANSCVKGKNLILHYVIWLTVKAKPYIYLTILEFLLERLLNIHPKTAHAAWEFLKKIFQDNKRSKVVELITELHSLNIGDLNAERYFRKIDTISAMLSNLESDVKDEDLVTYAINGLNDRFSHAAHIILHRNPFLSYNTVRSMITLEGMQLTRKNRSITETHGTPSAPTAIVAQSSNSTQPSNHTTNNQQVCRNFNRGHCRFAENCRYLHHHSRPETHPVHTNSTQPNNNTQANSQAHLLEIIAAQQQLLAQQSQYRAYTPPAAQFSFRPRTPLAHTIGPPGFSINGPQAQQPVTHLLPGPPDYPSVQALPAEPAHASGPSAYSWTTPTQAASIGSAPTQVAPTNGPPQQPNYFGQETLLSHAFCTMTLQDYKNAGWHMDTGATTHLTSSINNLSTIFNHFMYPSVAVGDVNTIPVTNVGHSVLPNIHRPLYLSNVLVTPNIVKNLISVRRFARDNKVFICFDEFGFSVKDYLTHCLLLRCDSSGELYPFTTQNKLVTYQVLLTTPTTWHKRLGHHNVEAFRRLISNNSIVCNNTKSPEFCHA